MWISFRLDGRDMEWTVTDTPTRYLCVRSRDGHFEVRAMILDNVFAKSSGKVVLSLIEKPVVIGTEFPLGSTVTGVPFELVGRGFELAKHGIIHTELVRSLVGRWCHRRRYRIR
jgi:hypothetical protein